MYSLTRFSKTCLPLILFFALIAVFGYLGKNSNRPARPQPMAEQSTEELSPAAKQSILQNYGKLPMRFEANQGQTDTQVKFTTRGSGYTMFLTPTEAVLSLRKSENVNRKTEKQPKSSRSEAETNDPAIQQSSTVVRMSLVGANPNPKVTGKDELAGKSNYFIGSDPSKWRTDVPNYRKVRYQQVYDGIDLVYYGNQQKLEYDFVVQPGADPDGHYPGLCRIDGR